MFQTTDQLWSNRGQTMSRLSQNQHAQRDHTCHCPAPTPGEPCLRRQPQKRPTNQHSKLQKAAATISPFSVGTTMINHPFGNGLYQLYIYCQIFSGERANQNFLCSAKIENISTLVCFQIIQRYTTHFATATTGTRCSASHFGTAGFRHAARGRFDWEPGSSSGTCAKA